MKTNPNQPLLKNTVAVFNDHTCFEFPFTTCASVSFETAKKQPGPKRRADHITISARWQRQCCLNCSPENAWAYVKHMTNAEILWKDYLVVPLGVTHHIYITLPMRTHYLYIYMHYIDIYTHYIHTVHVCIW